MRRSSGVTAAAIVALIGSGFDALIALLGIFEILFRSWLRSLPTAPSQGTRALMTAPVISSIVCLGFAVWGIATAIGLLYLKPWSRISILVFSGLLAFFAAFGPIMFLLMQMTDANPSFGPFSRVMMAFFFTVPFPVAIWWLIFFNRRSVAAQFSRTPEASSL